MHALCSIECIRFKICIYPSIQPSNVDRPMQVGTESLNMRQAMKIMKEQAAAMAVQAQQQAQEAAAQKADAEASLNSANGDLADECKNFADLQVLNNHQLVLSIIKKISNAALLGQGINLSEGGSHNDDVHCAIGSAEGPEACMHHRYRLSGHVPCRLSFSQL